MTPAPKLQKKLSISAAFMKGNSVVRGRGERLLFYIHVLAILNMSTTQAENLETKAEHVIARA